MISGFFLYKYSIIRNQIVETIKIHFLIYFKLIIYKIKGLATERNWGIVILHIGLLSCNVNSLFIIREIGSMNNIKLSL